MLKPITVTANYVSLGTSIILSKSTIIIPKIFYIVIEKNYVPYFGWADWASYQYFLLVFRMNFWTNNHTRNDTGPYVAFQNVDRGKAKPFDLDYVIFTP